MDLKKLIAYDKWANERIFLALKKVDEPSIRKEAEKLFAHLLTAQAIWVNRIENNPPPNDLWPDLSLSEMELLIDQNKPKLQKLISQKDEITSYKNSKGEEYENSVEEVLLHLTIHGQHHRAQIAKLLRQSGVKPPATDLIFFLRQ
ncbi:MAG TPA: hypothetical protein DD671_15305 [Balneolaceae bacterium]|nr:hypothetical protein [Balneolaceae bacterium]